MVNPLKKSQNDAMGAFTKNLNMEIKMFDPFKLQAQVVSRAGKKEYGFALGTKEGVHLDDYFDLIESYETRKGKIKNRRVGYVRVITRADNKSNPNNYSYAKQILGKKQSEGVVVMEYPLMGVDYRVSVGTRYGMSIKPEDTYIFSPSLFLDTEDALPDAIFIQQFSGSLFFIVFSL